MNRRDFLTTSLAATPVLTLPQIGFSQSSGNRMGITDWTIGARSKLEAFDLAKASNLASIQTSFTPIPGEGETDLSTEKDREALLLKSEETGVAIASTAMGVFNKYAFKAVPEAVEWAKAGVEATHMLGLEVMLMAFFGKNDLKNDAEGTAETIKRLKEVAPLAEERGVILGLETTIDADEHLHIIDSVGSPAVQVYYDTGNSHGNGYDINKEIRQLGNDLICEVHVKDKSGEIFGNGEVDFKGALQALEEIGYDRWYVLEGQKVGDFDQIETMEKHAAYLRQIGYSS
ncbi:MAG: sugar phosphate isomerase/epimerase [Verrucomicrobiales bacterium]|nr:sugar phosphate isomerase/epimerase [Verrucomicrobiales bacterium]